MKRIGKPFALDMEFTGSLASSVAYGGVLTKTLTTQPISTAPILSSQITFNAVRGYSEGEDKTVVIHLDEEQKKRIAAVSGRAPNSVEITLTAVERSDEIPLSANQKAAIEQALGLQMLTLNISRTPVEVMLK